MFKVKITMIGFLGDEKRYPCHFGHKVGDTVIYDGANFSAGFCSAVLVPIAQQVDNLFKMGPRYKPPGHYYPFWYSTVSVHDESLKKYDGIGFRNVLIDGYHEPQYHMANLAPKGAFSWPPSAVGTVNKDVTVVCGDLRTAAAFKLEAFDIADGGFGISYYRRSMVILNKILHKPGIAKDKLLKEFTKDEIEIPYPVLSQQLIDALVEDLSLVGHVEIEKSNITATDKGVDKVEEFKKSLSKEELKALKL